MLAIVRAFPRRPHRRRWAGLEKWTDGQWRALPWPADEVKVFVVDEPRAYEPNANGGRPMEISRSTLRMLERDERIKVRVERTAQKRKDTTMATVPHCFHDEIETLITRLKEAHARIGSAVPPHPDDKPLAGDERSHDLRTVDFERDRFDARCVIANALTELERGRHRERTQVNGRKEYQPTAAEIAFHDEHEQLLATHGVGGHPTKWGDAKWGHASWNGPADGGVSDAD